MYFSPSYSLPTSVATPFIFNLLLLSFFTSVVLIFLSLLFSSFFTFVIPILIYTYIRLHLFFILWLDVQTYIRRIQDVGREKSRNCWLYRYVRLSFKANIFLDIVLIFSLLFSPRRFLLKSPSIIENIFLHEEIIWRTNNSRLNNIFLFIS